MRFNNKFQRVIQLEFNEISKNAIDYLIKQGKLPNFATINHNWRYYQTTSEQQYEHLEPWIQWITAHTGKSFAEHQIFRLSDAIHLQHPQIWETLSQYDIESCIVGSMNAIRGRAKGGFFFPDPWSKNGITYPANIQPLWDLISKKVQSHATSNITNGDLLQGFRICRQFKFPVRIYRDIALQLISQKLDPLTKWKLPGIFDRFLMEIFKYLLKNKSYRYYTLFLNSVAHYQHHYWRNFQRRHFDNTIMSPDCRAEHDPVTYGYKLYDTLIGDVIKLAQDPNTLVIIASGLSQEPFTAKENQGGMNYYRLYNHTTLMAKLGLNHCHALPMMSRDWQVETNDSEKLNQAKQFLSAIRAEGEPVFKVTQNTKNSLFIETAITHRLKEDAMLYDLNGNVLGKFNDYFRNIAIKSGHHVGTGSLWLSQPAALPWKNSLSLTQLYPLTLSAFNIV